MSEGIEFILQREQQETMKQLGMYVCALCCSLALVAIGAFFLYKSKRIHAISRIRLAGLRRPPARTFPANMQSSVPNR